jgi:hypothetical protein
MRRRRFSKDDAIECLAHYLGWKIAEWIEISQGELKLEEKVAQVHRLLTKKDWWKGILAIQCEMELPPRGQWEEFLKTAVKRIVAPSRRVIYVVEDRTGGWISRRVLEPASWEPEDKLTEYLLLDENLFALPSKDERQYWYRKFLLRYVPQDERKYVYTRIEKFDLAGFVVPAAVGLDGTRFLATKERARDWTTLPDELVEMEPLNIPNRALPGLVELTPEKATEIKRKLASLI